MSLAIKFGDPTDAASDSVFGFVYFDAVTHYVKDFSGSVTSHPIARGGKISDHFIRNNSKYSITGVISGADISIGMNNIKDETGSNPINYHEDIDAVVVKDNKNALLSLVPNSISQYFVDAGSSVSVATTKQRVDTLKRIQSLLQSLFDKDKLSLITLYEYKNNRLDDFVDPVVMTSLTFTEDADSGYALYISMTLEKVEFASLKTTKLTKKQVAELTNVSSDIKAQAAPNKNVGNVSQEPPDLIKRKAAEIKDNIHKSALVLLGGNGGG